MKGSSADDGKAPASGSAKKSTLGGADLRNAQKEFAAAGRKLEKLATRIAEVHAQMATHDQSDYQGLGDLAKEIAAVQGERSQLETRWLQLADVLGE